MQKSLFKFFQSQHPAPRRQLMAVLTVKLHGLSGVTGAQAKENTASDLSAFIGAMLDIITKHQGVSYACAGSNIIAGFAGGDHQEKALLAAVEMNRQAALIRKGWSEEGRLDLEPGFGVHSGIVFLGHIGGGGVLMGDDVSLSMRLSEMAGPGDIFISGTVYNPLENHCEAVSSEMISVPWQESLVETYSLLSFVPEPAKERRRHKRKEVKTRILIRTETMKAGHAEVLVNISAGGFRMEGSLTLHEKTRLFVTLQFPDGGVLEGLSAEILESFKNEAGKWECRARFVDLPRDARDAITRFVFLGDSGAL